jgi:DnaJ-class molecular chaperone
MFKAIKLIIDGKESGPEPGPWELDMKSEFPLLFVSRKEARLKVPHSEAVEKCSGCARRGELPCPTCNKNNNREPGFYTSQTMIVCSVCHGRGLIAHTDGSDSICGNCKGEGRLPCSVCQSRGLVKCEKCRGDGSLLTRFPHMPKTSSEPANH